MVVLDLAVQVFAMLAVGALCARYRRAIAVLNGALFYATLPLSLLLSVARLAEIESFAVVLAAAAAHGLATMLIALLASKLFKLSWGRELATLASLPNALFIGFPLVGSLLGDSAYAVPHAVAFNVVLVSLLAYFGHKGPRKVRAASALYFASFLAGILLNLAGVRAFAAQTLDAAANAVSKVNLLSFIVVGAGIAGLKLDPHTARRLAVVAAFRYLVSPLTFAAALVAAAEAGAYVASRFVVGGFLQSLMPPAVTCIVLAKELGMDENLVTAGVAILSPVSIIIALALTKPP